MRTIGRKTTARKTTKVTPKRKVAGRKQRGCVCAKCSTCSVCGKKM